MKQTKLLIILDGWGHSEATDNNAIAMADTPNWDHLIINTILIVVNSLKTLHYVLL